MFLHTEAPSSVWLTSAEEGIATREARILALRGEGYDTEEIANREGRRWRDTLQTSFARLDIGADFGERTPSGVFTEYGLKTLEQQFGYRMLGDTAGICVFECDPPPRFVRSSADAVVTRNGESLRRAFSVAARLRYECSDVERLAYDLFSSSFFQPSADARLLTLMMALETLIQPEPRSERTREHVDKLIRDTARSSLTEQEKQSIIGSLRWLMEESIGQAGRRLSAKLRERRYMDLPPVKFFTRCYHLRSQLAHGAVPRPSREEVDRTAACLERFVGHLLSGPLLDEMPDV